MKFTARASAKIEEIADSENIPAPIIRIKVMGGGCAGFSYDMSFLEEEEKQQIGELDECWEMDGFDVVMDPISSQYLEGIEIDYVATEIGEGFKFNNPNVKSTCGCGSSVAF